MANPDPTSQFTFKSHETALCLIPPRHLWSSVDQLRSLYDKAFSAWPPHINLIYPFVRPEVLPEVANLLQDLSIEHPPRITLEGADTFNHKHHNTIFFRPSQGSTADITQLRRRICDALGQPRTNHGSFKPHMTIGQSEDSNAAPHHFLVEKVRLLPQLAWDVDSIAILVRDDAASGSNGSRPMRLWGTLDLSSRLLTRPTSPQDFRASSEPTSDIIFQPPYHSPQPSGPWAVLMPPAPVTNDEELILDRLVIASYNVLAEFEWPPQSVRHSGLVDNLLSTRSAADILVLQEATDHFLPVLLADQEIRRRYPFATHGPPGQFGIGPLPSLLNIVVLSRFPLEWHHLPFQRRHKGCTVVRFPTIGIRDRDACFRPWILAACHLSQGLTDGAITAKKREVQRMLDHLSAHFPQHPWILAGDFNLATSSFTIDAARKKQDISSQTVDHLQSIDHMLLDAGFTDTWLATRLESGESSDVVNDKRNVLDSFQGEQGATFDPLTNTLASGLVGSGLNNRPQRYDRILVKANDQYHPLGFNMFGQAPLQPTEQGGPTYASDHWGVRCLLLRSPSTEISRSSVPAMAVQLQRAPASLADNEVLEHFLGSQGFLPTAHERVTRAEALKALEHALLDATSSVSQGDARSGPVLILVPVGSYGLGVWTSSSDIDCLCIGSISAKTFFALAVQRLKRAATGGIRILRRVKANSGYMLELEVQGIKMDLQYCAAASIAERWPEVMKRPASDPAFALPFQTLAKLKPVRDLFYLRRSIPDMVQYRMAHLFIKAWAQSRGIYSAKFGFLGGIHIGVLLAPLCKMLANDGATVSTADIIVTFFQHYSRFSWKTALVFDPFFHKDLRYNRTFREPLCLLGWHAPSLNTAVNASVPTVDAIAAEFERAEKLLSVESFSWSNLLGVAPDSTPSSLGGPGATEFLQNYKSYIKIDAHYWGPSQEKSGRFIGWLESRCVMLLVDLDRKVKNIHARIWPARFLDMASSVEGPSAEYHGQYLIGLSRNGEEPNKDDAKATQVALQAALQEFEARIRRDEKYYDAQFCWMSAAVVRAPELGNLELDQSRWGEFAGDTDDEDEDDEMEEEENDSDGESQSTAKKNVASSHGSRAAVVSKTPGLGKFRTAADVLNRLRWDVGFDANDFIVGYEDRFLGPRERAVEQWKSEQTDEEFIPQHRILYFKRKSDGVVVWERRSRIDDIFGSGIKTDG